MNAEPGKSRTTGAGGETLRVLSLRTTAKRIGVGKTKLIREIRLGRLIPDLRSDTGAVLFWPARLDSLHRQLSNPTLKK